MSSDTRIRPCRSCLYMPGANARALDKASSLPADTLILDLEDSVAPELKTEARTMVADRVVPVSVTAGSRFTNVRVAPQSSSLCGLRTNGQCG